MLRILTFAAALMLLAGSAWAQPNLFALVGVEHPQGSGFESDLFMRAGGGFEWPGVFGEDYVHALGQYTWVAWGTEEVEDFGRFTWGVKAYLNGYWPDANPWVAAGVEHRDSSFIVGQQSIPWFSVGIEPAFMAGWIRMAWETSGFGIDSPDEHRWVLDFVPGSSKTDP